MILKKYFTEHAGTGVIATANDEGHVNTAIYAKPHIFNDSTLGFIMRDRLTVLRYEYCNGFPLYYCQNSVTFFLLLPFFL